MILVEKMVPGGQALGTLDDGKKIFLWNALPGERVSEYKVLKSKSHYVEAVATEIEAQSIHRVEPKDDCFLATSPWQIMDFNFELAQKSELVREVFRQHDIRLEDFPEVVTDEKAYYYRNKMEYALYWDNVENNIKLAFHERGSHHKKAFLTSSIERPEILDAAREIIKKLNNRHEEARKYQSLLLRCNQEGEISGGLFENGKPHPIFENLSDKILGVGYSYSPNGFFQINLPVYEMALKEISKWVDSADTEEVLDLYAGVGTIGLSVARNKKLTLVECNAEAHAESLNNIDGLKNVKSVLAKSENVLNYIKDRQVAILDPPRAGCDDRLIEKLLEVKPRRIVYLSCNPVTQARDIKKMLEKYIIKSIKTFNFFPRTPHIENLVVLDISLGE